MKPLHHFSDKQGNTYSVSLVDELSYPIDGINDPVIRAFFKIYQATIKDVQEHSEVITDRLKLKKSPTTYLAICQDDTSKAVIGGYILEYYVKSEFCLLPYIFVESAYQFNEWEETRKHIGINLGVSLQKLVNSTLISEENKLVKTVLFEIAKKNDFLIDVHFAPAARFFSKIDGIWIDVPYIEPISGRPDYLLGAIPISGNLRETMTLKDLYQFLNELYAHTNPELLRHPYFIENIAPWQNQSSFERRKITEKIREFPRLVQPQLQFYKASIAMHLIEEKGIKLDVDDLKKNKHVYDELFNSYEKDLFSQKFVEDPPYYSKHVGVQYATIRFSSILRFNSEGRDETLILVDHNKQPLSEESLEKQVKVYINYTVFRKKDRRKNLIESDVVWDLVISPIDYFNEYEFIQLEKYFTGKQEHYTLDITYLFNKEPCDDLYDFAQKVIGNNVQLRREVVAGTIQLDTSELVYVMPSQHVNPQTPVPQTVVSQYPGWTWPQIYQYYNSDSAAKKNSDGADKLELIYSSNKDAEYILNTFCGIALGIFDFDRMSIEEVFDTLEPRRMTDSYFVILNKNSIACFCEANVLYTNAIKYGIGINPYLIIPNSVLAYNSFLTIDVFEQTANLGRLQPDQPTPSPPQIKQWAQNLTGRLLGNSFKGGPDRLDELIFQKEKITAFLKNVVPNVYQYETERELYTYGMDKRGIVEKRGDLEAYKKEIDEEIAHLNNERSNLFGKLSLILGIISLSQIYQFFDSVQVLVTRPDPQHGLAKYLSLFCTFSLLVLFIYFSRKNYRIILVDPKKDSVASQTK